MVVGGARLGLTVRSGVTDLTKMSLQGKTTTLGIFGAALLCTAVLGGTLLCVYSTTLDRAQEVVKAAKQYMYWLKANRMAKVAVAPRVVTDNARTLVVQTPDGVSFCAWVAG